MKKIFCLLLACLILLIPLSSCARPTQKVSDSFYLMDTLITVTLYAPTDTDTDAIFSKCEAILSELDLLWSRTKEDSDTTRFNRSQAGELSVDPRTRTLIRKALSVSAITDGAFDITVAPILSLWQECEEAQRLPTDVEMEAAVGITYVSAISIFDGMVSKSYGKTEIDFGGIGKGAAVTALAEYLDACPIEGALISFGSNVAVVGSKPDGSAFRVAVKNPIDGNDYAKVVELSPGEVLSVSGDYERYYTIGGEKYHHIIDPTTGYPADTGLCSVAVICSDGAYADALSTALFVMGEERARMLYASGDYTFEAIFITSDGAVSTTDGLN